MSYGKQTEMTVKIIQFFTMFASRSINLVNLIYTIPRFPFRRLMYGKYVFVYDELHTPYRVLVYQLVLPHG